MTMWGQDGHGAGGASGASGLGRDRYDCEYGAYDPSGESSGEPEHCDWLGIHRDISPADRRAPAWLILFALALLALFGWILWRQAQ